MGIGEVVLYITRLYEYSRYVYNGNCSLFSLITDALIRSFKTADLDLIFTREQTLNTRSIRHSICKSCRNSRIRQCIVFC
jgi:hypothetical protein